LSEQQLKQEIKKQEEYQHRRLREQNFHGIDVRGVPDNAGIGPKKPKEKHVYSKK
jgi:hypothetical protein